MNEPAQNRGWLAVQFERGLMTLTRLPGWAVPPVIGAALLFVMTAFRGVFILLAHPGDPRALLDFGLALVIASAGGGAAGFVYIVIRPPLRPLKRVGDLLTGVILGCVYVFVLLVPAKYLFADDTLTTSNDWLVAAVVGAAVGVIGVVLYWYDLWRFK